MSLTLTFSLSLTHTHILTHISTQTLKHFHITLSFAHTRTKKQATDFLSVEVPHQNKMLRGKIVREGGQMLSLKLVEPEKY